MVLRCSPILYAEDKYDTKEVVKALNDKYKATAKTDDKAASKTEEKK
jgi:outer membrane protein